MSRNRELLLLSLVAGAALSLSPFAFPGRVDLRTLGLHFGAFLALHIILRFRRGPGNPVIVPVLYTLTAAGLLLHSFFHEPGGTTFLHGSYLNGVLAGCAAFAFIALVPKIDRLASFKYTAIVTAIALAAMLVVFGSGPHGTEARINLFGVQPAEAIKLLFVLFLAGYFADRDVELRRLNAFEWGWLRLPRMRDASPVLVTAGCVVALFFLQRDLGPALILYLLFLGSFAAVSGRWVLGSAGLAVLIGAFAASYKVAFLGTVKTRIDMWLHPWDNRRPNGIQLAESLWSLSSGGWHGLWSRASVIHLPAGHTDLILASAGEVFGFGGFAVLLILLLVLFFAALRTAYRAGTAFEAWFAYGLALLLGTQTVFMASATLGLVPLSGLPVPFLSYGKSAMIAGFGLAGLVWNISNSRNAGASRTLLPGGARVMPGILLAATLLCFCRAAQVCILEADSLLVQGALTPQADGVRRYVYNRRMLDLVARIRRGDILDRNGIALATSDPEHGRLAAAALAQIGFHSVPPQSGSSRYYTLGPAAVHILGHTGAYWTDPRTIEKSADTVLKGYGGVVRVVSVDGHRVASYDYSGLVPYYRDWQWGGDNFERLLAQDRSFRSTIDSELQLAAAHALELNLPVIEGKRAKNAAAVVLDAATGRILASVSLPSYDPNRISAGDLDRIYDAPQKAGLDRARFEVYPPGSSFKMVTAAAALESGEPPPTYLCKHENRVDWMDGAVHRSRVIADDETDVPHGLISLDRALVESCNVYFASLGTEIGAQRLYDVAARMHLELTGIRDVAQMRRDLADNAYGQGRLTASPLRMAAVAAVVANGGIYAEPHFDEASHAATEQVVSPETARHLREAMLSVVKDGTGRGVATQGLVVGGKTGTAQTGTGASDSWFIGFARREDSPSATAIAFAFFVEHGGYGARAAAPAARAFLSVYAGAPAPSPLN